MTMTSSSNFFIFLSPKSGRQSNTRLAVDIQRGYLNENGANVRLWIGVVATLHKSSEKESIFLIGRIEMSRRVS